MKTEYLLALNAHPQIGGQTIKKALASFGDNPEHLWKANHNALREKLGEKIGKLIIEARDQYVPEEEIEKLRKFNIGYTTIFDKAYPDLLLETPDAPAVLYEIGRAHV